MSFLFAALALPATVKLVAAAKIAATAKLTAATAVVVGSIIYIGSGNGPTPPLPPPPYPSTPTQEPPRPPPPYTRRPPATDARSDTAPKTSSALPDELAGVEDARKLREEARRSDREMKDAYSRANAAQQRGQHGVAQEHRQRGDAHNSFKEDLNERAANIFFRENNKVSN